MIFATIYFVRNNSFGTLETKEMVLTKQQNCKRPLTENRIINLKTVAKLIVILCSELLFCFAFYCTAREHTHTRTHIPVGAGPIQFPTCERPATASVQILYFCHTRTRLGNITLGHCERDIVFVCALTLFSFIVVGSFSWVFLLLSCTGNTDHKHRSVCQSFVRRIAEVQTM